MLVGPVSNAVAQIGDDGVLVVDTMMEADADAMVAEIKRIAPGKIIRWGSTRTSIRITRAAT
jgi:hypothetical protein